MLDQTGEGDPEWAQSLRTAGWKFKSLEDVLAKARPGQEWDGTASEAYAAKNEHQIGQVMTLGDADIEMAAIITTEAEQIYRTRDVLSDQHQFLADFGEYTKYLGIGHGRFIQAWLEAFAVKLAMMDCIPAMSRMSDDAKDNAAAVRKVGEVYQQVASKVSISDSTGDFDPPRTQPPGRALGPDEAEGPGTPAPPAGGAVPSRPAAPGAPVPGGPAPGVPVPGAPAPPAAPAPGAPTPVAPAAGAPASPGPAGSRQFAVRSETSSAPGTQRPAQQSSTVSDSAAAIAGQGERAPVEGADKPRETTNPSTTKT